MAVGITGIVIMTVIILLVIALSRYRSRNLKWRLRVLSGQLERSLGNKQPVSENQSQILRKICEIAQSAIARQDSIIAYQAIDLLKIAYTNNIYRPDEPNRLTGVLIAALRGKQPDTAGAALGAFRPMARASCSSILAILIEQFIMISSVSFREKQYFLIAKSAEIIAEICEKGVVREKIVQVAVLRTIKVIGILALRRGDSALFRELCGIFTQVLLNGGETELSEETCVVMVAWLHRIACAKESGAMEILSDAVSQVSEAGIIKKAVLLQLTSEWRNIAGTSCRKPNDLLAPQTVFLLFQIAAKQEDMEIWLQAIASSGQLARVAFEQHGIEGGFALIYPLLDTGRKLFVAELKFGEYSDGFRRQILFQIVRECMTLTNVIARKEMMKSEADIIIEMYHLWKGYPQKRPEISISEKSVKKYCQFLLLFWLQTCRKKAKRVAVADNDLLEPSLLTENEKQRLGVAIPTGFFHESQ